MLLALDDAPWSDADDKPCSSRRLPKLPGQYVTPAHKPIKPRGIRTLRLPQGLLRGRPHRRLVPLLPPTLRMAAPRRLGSPKSSLKSA